MDIDGLIDAVIAREGGYVNDARDAGGATRWGITEAVARAQGYVGVMRELPHAEAAAIYKRLYWLRPRFDAVAERAPKLAAELFDTGVNMGAVVAAGFMQRALNALNRGQRDYPDLKIDGAIGAATLSALDGYLKARGQAGEVVLIKACDALQGERYLSIAQQRPVNEAFLYGWIANRIG